MTFKPPVTIKDVAALAGVSGKSVSRVLNDEPGLSPETRQRIQHAINTLGYVANPNARRLRGASNVLGLVVPNLSTVGYMGQVVQGVSEATRRLKYNLVLYIQNETTNLEESTAQYVSLVNSGMTDGLLMIVPHNQHILAELCAQRDVPYVLVDWHGSDVLENVPMITTTNRRGMVDVMRHLLALGHRRIGYIGGTLNVLSARERLQGYRDGLAEINVTFDTALVVEGEWSQRSGYHLTKQLLDRNPDLTALVTANDDMAFGAMMAVRDHGLSIGTDISIVGFDDVLMASQVHPGLTTVRQPMYEMGEAAAEVLIAMLRGQPPLKLHRQFSTELIVRESTGVVSARQLAEKPPA